MRVLILGSDTPLGIALVEQLELLGRHELILLSLTACRWKSERQAKKSVVRAKCDLCLDLRIEAAGYGDLQLREMDVKRVHWVAKACQRNQTTYFYLSSSRVFSGQLDRPYEEADAPDNHEAVGQLLASIEQVVLDVCDRHIILRVGPIFSADGVNLITQLLGPMGDGDSLILDNNLRGCPVAAADGARVVSALLDQLGTGLEAWGIYHYGSSDTATYYEFGEALLASASQFFEFSASAVQLEKESEGLPPRNRALDCDKIRNTFAVRQIPWRGTIGALVKHYYDEQAVGELNDQDIA